MSSTIGERKIFAPAATTTIVHQRGSKRMTIDGGIRVTHSELFGNVTSSVNPLVSSVVIQPGLLGFSTWLSAQAQDFDQYRLVSFVAEYIPTCSTLQTGNVMMTFDYDATDPIPLTEQAMSAYQGATESSCWSGFRIAMDAKSVHAPGPRKYLRAGPTSGDERVYDSGQLFVMTSGGNDGVTPWGRVWLHYTFDLLIQTSPINNQVTKWYAIENSIPQVVPATTQGIVVFDTILNNWQNAFGFNPPWTILGVPPGGYVCTVVMEVYNTVAVTVSNNVLLRLLINGLVQQQVAASWPVIGSGMSQVMTLVFGITSNSGLELQDFQVALQNNLNIPMTIGVNSQVSFTPA